MRPDPDHGLVAPVRNSPIAITSNVVGSNVPTARMGHHANGSCSEWADGWWQARTTTLRAPPPPRHGHARATGLGAEWAWPTSLSRFARAKRVREQLLTSASDAGVRTEVGRGVPALRLDRLGVAERVTARVKVLSAGNQRRIQTGPKRAGLTPLMTPWTAAIASYHRRCEKRATRDDEVCHDCAIERRVLR